MTDQEAQLRLRRAIVEDVFPDDNPFPSNSPFTSTIPDPLKFERNTAVSAWMSQATGRNINYGSAEWQAEKDAAAKGFFRQTYAKNVSDEEMHSMVRSHLQTSEEMAKLATQTALVGNSAVQGLAEFDAKRGASPLRGIWERYQSDFQQVYAATAARIAPYRQLVDETAGMLGTEMQAILPTTDAFKSVADRLLQIPAADRHLVISAIGAKGAATPDEKRSYLEKLAMAVGRETESIGSAVESGLSSVIMAGAAGETMLAQDLEGFDMVQRASAASRDRYVLAQMIRQVADGSVSPLETEGYLQETGMGLAKMAPLTVMTLGSKAGSFAVMTAYFRDQTAASLMLENPDMTREQADGIALVSSPLMAGVEVASNLIPFGKMPAVERFLKTSISSRLSGLARFGIRGGAGVLGETGEELAQSAIPAWMQDLANAMNKDIGGVDWHEKMKELRKIPAQVFGPALIMSAIGAGGASISDIKNGRALAGNRDLLVASGYSPALSDEIAKASEAGDWRTVDTLFARGFKPKAEDASTPEQRQAALATLMRAEAVTGTEVQDAMAAAEVSMRKTADGWTVSTPDSSTAVADYDAAYLLAVGEMERQGMTRDEQTIKAFEAMTRKAGDNQEFVLSDRDFTALDELEAAQGRGDQASIDAIQKRAEVYRRQVNSPDLPLSKMTVLGRSSVELRDDVKTYVQTLYSRGSAVDLVEEKAEADVKRWIAGDRTTLGALRGMILQAEKATGDTYLHGDADTSVIEAYSTMARLWATGTRKGDVPKAVQAEARNQRRRLKQAGGPLTRLFQETMDFFREVLRQASRLAKARRAGTLGDIESFLNESLGLTEEAAHVDAVGRQVQDMGADLNTYSFQRAVPETSAKTTVLPDGAKLVGPTTFSIKAFHGTPHKVDRFSTDKIGTGEGAQAYGWGLYFAADPQVARSYQKGLTERDFIRKVKEVFSDFDSPADAAEALAELELSEGQRQLLTILENEDWWGFDYPHQAVQAAIREPQNFDASPELMAALNSFGQLYTVDLLPNEDEFLDWDKPLSSTIRKKLENSKKVSEIIDPDGYGFGSQIKGYRIYSILADKLTPKEASSVLSSVGIPGIRYLDGNSRDSGQGTRNYVIFDESLVKIIEENGVPVDTSSYSFGLTERLDALSAALDGQTKGKPEARRNILERAQEKLSMAREAWEAIDRQAKAASRAASETPDRYGEELAQLRADFDAEMTEIRTERETEIGGAKADKAGKETVNRIKAEYSARLNRRRLEYERDRRAIEDRQSMEEAAQAKEEGRISRQEMNAALRTLDAVVSVLPPELRGKVGGFIKLSELNSNAARIDEIESRFEKVQDLLETYFRKELTEQVEKLFERYRPERASGEKPKGKLDPDAQELVDAAEAAMSLDADKTAELLGAIDAALANPDITAEQEVQLDRKRVLVELFGDWRNADAGRMSAALDALKNTASEGWAKWRMKQILKRESRQAMRDSLRQDTGKTGLGKERDLMRQDSAKIIGQSRDAFLNLSSFTEVLKYVFGNKSKTAQSLADSEREASNQYEDAIQAMADRVQDHFTQLAGGVLKGEQMRYDMSRPKITVGQGDSQRTLSELQGIQALLMWQQEDGRRHMEGPRNEANQPIAGKWHYTQEWIDDLTKKLPPRALRTKQFLEQVYSEEYTPLNALYRQRHGVNLPQHRMYAPITVAPQQAKAGEMVDPVSGAAISGSILTPGALRSRNRTAVAEPRFEDALATMIAHNKQMEHWKSYYDFAVDAQAVMGNREVMNSVEAAAGQEAVKMLRKWVETFAQGGIRDAAAGMATTQRFQRMANRAATVGLLGRVSTILVQSTQLAAASVQMPTGAYMLRLSKLLTGQLSWGDAIKSEFIQRRIKTAPPIVQQAMAGLAGASRPNQITRAVRLLGSLLTGADGLFTGGTYAILLDWHRGNAAKMGLEGAEAEAFAHQEAARATEEVAQPVRMANRSMMELTNTNPLAKAAWAYSSEARQKIALFAWSVQQIKNDPARFIKSGVLTFVVGGFMSQIIKNLWREMKGDDDDRKWSAERLLIATIAGPLHGIPLVSELTENGGLFNSAMWAKPAAERVFDALTGESEYNSVNDALKDVSTILGAAGYFNDTLAGVAALSNAGLDFAKLLDNATNED